MVNLFKGRFPAPREVDRQLYLQFTEPKAEKLSFPAPPEVDKYLYIKLLDKITKWFLFPAPLEVDRQLYEEKQNEIWITGQVSGPSRGRQVAIQVP